MGCSLRVAALLALLGAALAERRTVLYVPLDERFATRGMFLNMARLLPPDEFDVVTPGVELLPRRKRFADPDGVLDWLERAASDAAASGPVLAVVSAEMVLYGGLIASRSSNDTSAVVQRRLDRITRMGEGGLNIFLSTVVMRIPCVQRRFRRAMVLGDCLLYTSPSPRD